MPCPHACPPLPGTGPGAESPLSGFALCPQRNGPGQRPPPALGSPGCCSPHGEGLGRAAPVARDRHVAVRGPRSRHTAKQVSTSASPVLPEAPSWGVKRVTEGGGEHTCLGAPVLSVRPSVCLSVTRFRHVLHPSAVLQITCSPAGRARPTLGRAWSPCVSPWPGLPVACLQEGHRSRHVWAL